MMGEDPSTAGQTPHQSKFDEVPLQLMESGRYM